MLLISVSPSFMLSEQCMPNYHSQIRLCFWSCWFPDMCLGPRNNTLNFEDDPDYDPHLENGSSGGGLQSLTDCLVPYVITRNVDFRIIERFVEVN